MIRIDLSNFFPFYNGAMLYSLSRIEVHLFLLSEISQITKHLYRFSAILPACVWRVETTLVESRSQSMIYFTSDKIDPLEYVPT